MPSNSSPKTNLVVVDEPIKGEHIFPDTKLTVMAIRWKELNSAGRHKEAMALLEDIIIGSTAMFERLAQYENFHYFADLPILVSAAQEKVVKWLLLWQPKKGKLFSWFSKSVTGDTQVTLADGSQRRIDDIVNNKEKVSVVSWNPMLQRFEIKQVVDWHRSPACKSEWRKLSVKHPSGYSKLSYVTGDHEVMTTFGWKAVDDLAKDDVLYTRSKCITAEGIGAVIGMYLGDGCIADGYILGTGHGGKQLEYSKHIASKFLKNVHVSDAVVAGKLHKDVSKVSIPLLEMWPSSRGKLKRSGKKIDSWLLENMNEVSLAYWFMDDGYAKVAVKKPYKIGFATCNFTEADCNVMISYLQTRWGLKAKWSQRKGESYGNKVYGDIVLDQDSTKAFYSLAAPYVLPLFDYKLDPEARLIPKKDPDLVSYDAVPAQSWTTKSVIWGVGGNKGNSVKVSGSRSGKWFTPDWSWKYDITVEDNHNFLAETILVHNCAKNAFRCEVAKVNQYRKRFHVTGDDLEKFYGFDDHEVNKHDAAADFRSKLKNITARWGDPQEIGAIHYLIECIVADDHDKNQAITGAAYAWGISIEMSKFFYTWALVAMRNEFYEKSYVRFSEQDLFRYSQSYTYLPDMADIVGWDNMKKLIGVFGGMRIKFPTTEQLAIVKKKYELYREIEASDKDPDTVASIGKKSGTAPKTAQEVYNEMHSVLHPHRAGEHGIYD